MTRLFGTDGIRGVANVDLRPSLAFSLGRATAHLVVGAGRLARRGAGHPAFGRHVRGRDHRRRDEHGRRRPPGRDRAHAGPRVPRRRPRVRGRDHGLGVAQPGRGQRAQGARPAGPEARRRRRGRPRGRRAARRRAAERVARRRSGGPSRRRRSWRATSPTAARSRGPSTRRGLHVVLDTANGAAYRVAPEILRATGARVTVIHDAPDGDNINRAAARRRRPRWPTRSGPPARTSGSRSTATPTAASRSTRRGNLVDGDQVLGILALERLARGALDHGSLVVSVLSNGGLQAAVEEAGGRIVRTPVGDKHILAAMLVSGAGLGGEKSGHVIIREHTHVGRRDRHGARAAAGHDARRPPGSPSSPTAVPLLPQQQRAIRVRHRDQWEDDDVLGRAIADAERRLAPHGRVLVRPSGTEPVLRVMVEGPDAAAGRRARRRHRGARRRPTTLANRGGAAISSPRRTPQAHVRHRRLYRPP